MKRLMSGFIAALLATLHCGAQEARSYVLVQDGVAKASLVLAATPSKAAQFAAGEIQHHVRLITGVTLPIVQDGEAIDGIQIAIGDTSAARKAGIVASELGPQEYVVAGVEGGIILVGLDSAELVEVVYDPANWALGANWPGLWEAQATLYAAYDFLENQCGVRWLNQTELGTVYDERTTLSVEVETGLLPRRPFFAYRDTLGAVGDNVSQYDRYTHLWSPQDEEFQAWDALAYAGTRQQYAGGGFEAARAKLSQLFLLRHRSGGSPARCNHSLYGYYARFWEKRPGQEALFEEQRPEYFAKGYEGEPPQLCYMDPGLVKQVAQDARDYYDGKSTAKEQGIFWNPTLPNPFPVEPMDNSFYCKCERCQEYLKVHEQGSNGLYTNGVYSDYFFQFVNAVAEELATTHPDKVILTLAYSSHGLPPSFEMARNVQIEYCVAANRSPFSTDYAHELEVLRQWATLTPTQPLYLWLYYTFPLEQARNGKYHCFPGFFAHAIGEQFRFFADQGVNGMFHCGWGQEVEAYVTLKLMVDPRLDVEMLLDEYFKGLYGAAAAPMKQMYLAMEKTYVDPALRLEKGASGPGLAWGRLGTAERMAEFQAFLDQAKGAATTEREQRAIAMFEHSTWSYMLQGRASYVERQKAPIPTVNVPRLAAVDGDLSRIDWSKAAPLSESWYVRGGSQLSERRYSGRVAHDGEWLYLELIDHCPTEKVVVSPGVFPFDDWELFIARQRDLPYRQVAVGPTGSIKVLSHGEVNWRRNVVIEEHGVQAVSDTSAPDQWVTRLAISFDDSLAGGRPEGRIFLNIVRVINPALAGEGRLGIDTWVSHCTVHEVDRLGELVLQP